MAISLRDLAASGLLLSLDEVVRQHDCAAV
jgi:hypothetical protein